MVTRSKRQYVHNLNSPALDVLGDRKEARGALLPGFIAPCLAEARDKPPTSDEWLHEIKFDGYRLQLRLQHGEVNCFTRRGYDWHDRFPTLVSAARKLKAESLILDGEAVVVRDNG